MKWKKLALVPVVGALGGVGVLAGLSVFSPGPGALGAAEGRLAPCPDKPNCVCSQDADEAHHVEPLTFDGPPTQAQARLKAVLAALPRVRVVTDTGTYLHAECTSLVFRFVDDLEFLLDPDKKLIHVRSASRAGHSDLGANRRRVEAIRQAFAEQAPATNP